MGKALQIVGIILMSLTASFTVLSGAGTTCVALGAEEYPSMAGIVPYKWLYVLFVIVTLAIGVMGVRAVLLLIKGRPNAYRYSLIALILGVLVGGIHIGASRVLRGSSMPVDAVFYTSVLTLVVFLIFRIPCIWQKVDFERADANGDNPVGGMAAIVMGVLCLTIQIWMGPTHTFYGINYADALHTIMTISGWGLILIGGGWLAYTLVDRSALNRYLSTNKEASSRLCA
jgi:hypothetical protein